jgi:hypothetical protein
MVFGGNYTTGSSTKIAYAAITGRKQLATSGNADGYLAFYTWLSTGMTEKMRIDRIGNVGIGTETPTTGYPKVLQIHSPTLPGSTLRLTDSVSTSAVNKGFELLYHTVDSYVINRSNGVMYFWTNNSNAMTIKANHNVGIGTTDPLAKLQVDNPGQGEFAGGNSSAGGGSHLMLKDEGSTSRTLMSGPSVVFHTPASPDGTNAWATSRLLGSPAAAGSARGTFSIQVRDQYDPLNDGTSWNWRTALTAINTGKVGIGTNSPNTTL